MNQKKKNTLFYNSSSSSFGLYFPSPLVPPLRKAVFENVQISSGEEESSLSILKADSMEEGGSWERLRVVMIIVDMLGQNPRKNQRAVVNRGVLRKRSRNNDAGAIVLPTACIFLKPSKARSRRSLSNPHVHLLIQQVKYQTQGGEAIFLASHGSEVTEGRLERTSSDYWFAIVATTAYKLVAWDRPTPGLGKLTHWIQSCLLHGFVNKMLLEHTLCLFVYILSLLLSCKNSKGKQLREREII